MFKDLPTFNTNISNQWKSQKAYIYCTAIGQRLYDDEMLGIKI